MIIRIPTGGTIQDLLQLTINAQFIKNDGTSETIVLHPRNPIGTQIVEWVDDVGYAWVTSEKVPNVKISLDGITLKKHS